MNLNCCRTLNVAFSFTFYPNLELLNNQTTKKNALNEKKKKKNPITTGAMLSTKNKNFNLVRTLRFGCAKEFRFECTLSF